MSKEQSSETTTEAAVQWLSIGGGRLAVFHRPKLARLAALQREGCTHVLTLLSEREQARTLGLAVEKLGLQWIWAPLPNGDPPPPSRDHELLALLQRLSLCLAGGASILIHCSAGIHRTGMITNALLRVLGLGPEEARAALLQLRQVTHDGVGAHRVQWGDRLSEGFVVRSAP